MGVGFPMATIDKICHNDEQAKKEIEKKGQKKRRTIKKEEEDVIKFADVDNVTNNLIAPRIRFTSAVENRLRKDFGFCSLQCRSPIPKCWR